MNTPQPPAAPTVQSQLQNQNTAFGNLNYSQGPNGTWTSTSTPTGALGQGINNNLNAFASENPISINNAVDQGSQFASNYMAPLWNQQQSNLNSQLQNEGFAPGDQAAQLAQRQLQGNQSQYLESQLPAFENAALQNYQAPLQAAGAAGQAINGSYTPNQIQPAVQTQTGAQQFDYGQQIANQAAMLGGLFAIPSAALGGWAKNGFGVSPSLSSLFSPAAAAAV